MRRMLLSLSLVVLAATVVVGCGMNASRDFGAGMKSDGHTPRAPAAEAIANLRADELWIIPRPGLTKVGSGTLGTTGGTYNGLISGSGGVAVDSVAATNKSGVTTSGANTYTGGTTISGGTLMIAGALGTAGPAKSLRATASDMKVTIDTFFATCIIRQQFENPGTSVGDVEYSFTLPERTMVTDFLMDIGPRHIRGVVIEQSEALALYAAAHKQGLRATLLTQSSGNVFTATIGQVAPGVPISTRLMLLQMLAYADGEFIWKSPVPASTPITLLELHSASAPEKITSPTHGLSFVLTAIGARIEFMKVQHPEENPAPELHFRLPVVNGQHSLVMKEKDAAGRICVAVLAWPRPKAMNGTKEKTLKIAPEVEGMIPGNPFAWPDDQPIFATFYPAGDTKAVAVVHENFKEEYLLAALPMVQPRTLSILNAVGRIAQLRAEGKTDEARKLAIEAALVTPETAFVTVDATKP